MREGFRHIGVLLLSCVAVAASAQDRALQIAPVKPAPAGERRVALVIGNSAYKSSPLRNPVRDARAISRALAETGFKVTVLENATETGMRRAIRTFGDELAAGGVGLFYYAGHGMQVRGRNYLIPVNADIEREDEVEDQALDANLVLSKMDSAKNSLNLMILDACRNNPFARAFRSAAQGLAQMDAPSGTLVAFATAPGSVASDGEGDNGLYTKHLLANMTRPGLPIEQLFKEVRIGVGRDTGDRQVPWESSSLRGNFFFIAPDPSLSAEARKRELEKAVAEAVRGEQEKLAAQQREMQAMIREMLAKQRAELEEEMRRRAEASGAKPPAAKPPAAPVLAAPPPAAPAPAAKPAAAPVLAAVSVPAPSAPLAPEAEPPALDPLEDANDPLHLAAVAAAMPAVSQVDDPRYPKVGDHWEYAYTDVTTRTGSHVNVKILGVASDGILDADDFDSFVLTRRAYGAGAELLILDPIWVFSPYLHVFGAANPGASWSEVESRKDRFCARNPSCSYSARVVGSEKVTTPAGSFDAIKVTVDLSAGMGGFYLRRQATFWYAEAAKRLVKSTLRTLSGQTHEPDYDLELVSYKLN